MEIGGRMPRGLVKSGMSPCRNRATERIIPNFLKSYTLKRPQYSESTKTYELGNGLWKGCMTKADRRYIEFHARSAFSFLEGASLPEELIARCAEFQMPAMALLDRDGVYGAPRFHMTAKKLGIRAHIGAEISLQDFGTLENPLLRGAAPGLRGVSSGHQRDIPLYPLQRGNHPFPS